MAAVFPDPPPLPFTQLRRPFRARLPSPASILRRRRLGMRPYFVAAKAMASSSAVNVDYLETEFGGHGVSFEGIGESFVAKMSMRNGSTASLMLPGGLITSYKPRMWHGATLELLHTTVTEGESGEAVAVQGGASLDLMFGGEDMRVPWTPSSWHLHSVRGSPQNSIQVELAASVPPEKNMAEVKWLVTLDRDSIGSEVIIANKKSSALEFSGSFINHLKVSTPDASYVAGMQGSNYCSRRPISSEFTIIPPEFDGAGAAGSSKYRRGPSSWTQNLLVQSMQRRADQEEDDEGSTNEGQEAEAEGEELEDYAHMAQRMSRIYTSAPRQFTMIDRGRRNSVVIGRSGFDEFYMLSPGSEHEWYGDYAYLCVGPSAVLRPLRLEPGGVWRGAQRLCNPNL